MGMVAFLARPGTVGFGIGEIHRVCEGGAVGGFGCGPDADEAGDAWQAHHRAHSAQLALVRTLVAFGWTPDDLDGGKPPIVPGEIDGAVFAMPDFSEEGVSGKDTGQWRWKGVCWHGPHYTRRTGKDNRQIKRGLAAGRGFATLYSLKAP